MSENDESIVCPGEQVGLEVEVRAGKGCYARGGAVFASVVGSKQQQPAAAEDGDQRPVVQVVRRGEQRKVPLVGDVVTVKILRVMPRNATASILCIGTQALDRAFSGLIRVQAAPAPHHLLERLNRIVKVQDVRAQEIDKVQMYASFRPGDIVRAEVLSMGDARGSYFLSTAKNTLGVLHAKGPTGEPMVPLSWTHMQCPKTKAVEERKVACTS